MTIKPLLNSNTAADIPMTPPVVGDDAIAMLAKEQHLPVLVVR